MVFVLWTWCLDATLLLCQSNGETDWFLHSHEIICSSKDLVDHSIFFPSCWLRWLRSSSCCIAMVILTGCSLLIELFSMICRWLQFTICKVMDKKPSTFGFCLDQASRSHYIVASRIVCDTPSSDTHDCQSRPVTLATTSVLCEVVTAAVWLERRNIQDLRQYSRLIARQSLVETWSSIGVSKPG